RRHKAEMDAGCKVSWEYCYDPKTEISAIQHAYNALIDDGMEVFSSEFQQQPSLPEDDGEIRLHADDILEKLNNRPKGQVPTECQSITAMVDIQDKLLYYVIIAWEQGFNGYVLDYGAYPDQK